MKVCKFNSCETKPLMFGKAPMKAKIGKMPNDDVQITTNKPKKETLKDKLKKYAEKIKMGAMALAGAVVSGLAVFLVMDRKVKKEENINKELKIAFDNIILPDDMQERTTDKLAEISKRTLEYDPTISISTKIKTKQKLEEDSRIVIEMPKEREHTENRADAKKLNYPKFTPGKPYHYTFPVSDEMKISKAEYDFTPQALTNTTISESYADSLKWDDNKIARDLMQNFFDGHGQTLDGVSVDITPCDNGKNKVRISGLSSYSPDKAILLGESSKKDDTKAAGCYGEGLKMVVLKLLREKGADNVGIASDNWRVNWSLENSSINNKKVLSYKLDKEEPINGNYIEFETDSKDFINAILDSYDRFYHYNNPAFKCPDFENDKLGIKLLADNHAKGKLFLAGQEFEIDGKYDNFEGANLFIKERPPIKVDDKLVFDPSRDRTSLTRDNIESLGDWLASKDVTSNEDGVKIIHTLIDYWQTYPVLRTEYKGESNNFLYGFLRNFYYTRMGEIEIKFPDEKYIADSWGVSSELKDDYDKNGYKICYSYFEEFGMPSIGTIVNKTREHKALLPTEAEKNKILLIKDALSILAPLLKSEDKPIFKEEELNPKILIFDKDSRDESKVYKNTSAEAIIDRDKTLGFWIDRSHLKEDFGIVLGTALHELTHKYGGDESMQFSYALTDVIQKVLKEITDNPNIAIQLKVLEKAWNEQK